MPIVANCAVAEERLCRRELQPPPLKPPSPSSLSASERESSRKRGTLSRHAPSSLELHRRRRPAAVRGESSPSRSLPEEESLHKGLLEWLAAAARATAPLAAGNLDLSSNQIEGAIPTLLGNFTSLASLDISDNQLEGEIPTFLENLTSLVSLDISGHLSNQLGMFKNLEKLDLSNNSIVGEIPQSLAELSSLKHAEFSRNQL
ncbi:hypothetical protein AHAS_Ahas06G0261300 [Arachis hypogaea]